MLARTWPPGGGVEGPPGLDCLRGIRLTASFHRATQNDDAGLPMAELLPERGADLNVRAKLPGHYGRPGEVVECTPPGYATLFPGNPDESQTVALLQKHCTGVTRDIIHL